VAGQLQALHGAAQPWIHCGGVDTGVKFFFRGPPRSWRPLRGLIIIIGSSKVCLVFG
jgi:hypothetical protein